MKFYIYAPGYNQTSGGSVVLHRLCHIINQIEGCQAWLVKADPGSSGRWSAKTLASVCKWHLINKHLFKTNPEWVTPIYYGKKFPDDSIVIYPEITNGNPLKIKNVVRWLLHQPGFHTKRIKFSTGELYFKFNSAIKDFFFQGSRLSAQEMKVIYYPIDIYNQDEMAESIRDLASCHMIRKGKDKPLVHSSDSVLLDGLSHDDIAAVFKRSKRFICYDDYTAYSIFAVLCGCESVVIPGEDRGILDWYPEEKDRFGIAYGLSKEQLCWAKNTQDRVYEQIIAEHDKSALNVRLCIMEMKEYFHI